MMRQDWLTTWMTRQDCLQWSKQSGMMLHSPILLVEKKGSTDKVKMEMKNRQHLLKEIMDASIEICYRSDLPSYLSYIHLVYHTYVLTIIHTYDSFRSQINNIHTNIE